MAIHALLRRMILAAAHDPSVRRFVRRYGMRLGAARFVAGETLDECVRVLRSLNAQGLATNTTILGEGVRDAATARAVVEAYEAVLDRIAREGLRTNVALKLSHLGLDLGEEPAYDNLARLAARARDRGNFIRIDMEESWRVDAALRIYRRLRAAGYQNVGAVLQAYLYRSAADLQALLPLRPNLRLVKGAYLEPPDVAYPRKTDVDANFFRLITLALDGGAYTAVATHDDRIIRRVIDYTRSQGIGRDRFEFQMLYGVRPQLQLDLVRQGYRVLVATPHGPDWYPYLMRRLAERPANLLFFLRNALRR